MQEAIQVLMHEHQVILRVLGSLEEALDRVERGERIEREWVRDCVEFFRRFADADHHAKEEDHLFGVMRRYGFSQEMGPIAIMLAEHDQGRVHISLLQLIADGEGPLSREERAKLVENGRSYIDLQRLHIEKEDEVLYPMVMRALPDEAFDAIFAGFESLAAEHPDGSHEMHALAARIAEKYEPNPAALWQLGAGGSAGRQGADAP